MMRRSHPSLFMVAISILMAGLLFISNPIPVYALPIVPVIVIIVTALGLTGGFLLHEYFAEKPETPGVDLDSYAEAEFNAWRTYTDNKLEFVDFFTATVGRMDLYYIRRAEYKALDYLSYSELPPQVMTPVAKELCQLQQQLITAIHAQFEEADNIQDREFTADLEDYVIYVKAIESGEDINFRDYEADAVTLKFQVSASNSSINAWDCETQTATALSEGDLVDLSKYLILGSGNVEIMLSTGGHAYEVRLQEELGTLAGYDLDDMKETIARMISRFSEIYWQAWNFAKTYHSTLRQLGYTDKNQVPLHFICPPPDVAFYDLNDLAQSGMSTKDIAYTYLFYLKKLGDLFDQDMGCLMGESGNVTFTVTETATITTVINGTTVTTTTTSAIVISPDNIPIPDVYTRLKNAQICINGNCFNATWVAIVDTFGGDVSFTRGQPTTLQNPMRVIIEFPNGTKTMMDLPSGTVITPEDIVTHSQEGDVSHDQYTYQEKPLPYWYEKWWQPNNPNFLTPADKNITAMLEIVMGILPLILILAVIKMIMNLGKWR